MIFCFAERKSSPKLFCPINFVGQYRQAEGGAGAQPSWSL